MASRNLKTRISEWLGSKSETERQKLKKYLIVIPGAFVIFLGSMWLIFGSYLPGEDTAKGKANMELPEGDSDGLQGNKLKALADEALREEKARQDSVLQVSIRMSDSIPERAATDSAATPIEQSAQSYREVQESLNNFFVEEEAPDAEIDALNERIAELEAQNEAARQNYGQPDEMAMLERSYQLAAKYMGNGNGGNYPPPPAIEEEKGKRNVQPVSQVSRDVVSSLNASNATRRLTTAVGTARTVDKNTIAAVVAGNQSVADGESVRLRTTEAMWIGNRLVPRNTAIVGVARIQGERLEIEISSVECQGSIYDVELLVYDSDGQEGINIPGSMESDALHEIGANMGSTMGSSINISTNTGAQIASDVGRGLINGVSQYLTKKMRTVKVHLKAGYRVMLHQPEDV